MEYYLWKEGRGNYLNKLPGKIVQGILQRKKKSYIMECLVQSFFFGYKYIV